MRIIRYLIAGSMTTLLALGLLYFFNSILHLHYLPSSSLSFAITLIASYLSHKYWTFQNDTPEHGKQLSKHAALMGWNFALNALLMLFFVGILELKPIIGQTATSGLIAIQSFIIYSRAIFI